MNEPQGGQGRWQRVNAWLRGQRGWLTIANFHDGDIRVETPVLVTAAGAVNGAIIAPKVVIAGQVGGDVAALSVNIGETGLIWGNVAAQALTMAVGGKFHGWFVTIDEDGFLLLQSGETVISAIATSANAVDGDVAVNGIESLLPFDESQLAYYRRLQAEAAAAVMARAELELQFEAQVNEAAGEKIAEAAALREELTVLRSELLQVQSQLNASQAHLVEQGRQLEIGSEELLETRNNLAQQMARVAELEEKHQAVTDTLFRTTSERDMLNDELADQLARVESLNERLGNLEVVMQASLQRTAEQEDSLIRWQELAEVSEERARQLDEEVTFLRSRLADSGKIAETLRQERERHRTAFEELEEERLAADQRVAELEVELEAVQAQLQQLQETHAQKASELRSLRETRMAHADNWDDLVARLNEATAALAVAQEQIDELGDQLVWTRASEKAAGMELLRIRGELAAQSTQIAELENTARQQTTLAENWKNNVNRTLNMLFAAEQQVEALQADVARLKVGGGDGAARDDFLQMRMRMEAAEKELQRYLAESERQGGLLAEMQAEVVERDITISRLNKANAAQVAQLAQLKQAARDHIQALSGELTRTRQQLADLSSWVERQQRQGRFPQREG